MGVPASLRKGAPWTERTRKRVRGAAATPAAPSWWNPPPSGARPAAWGAASTVRPARPRRRRWRRCARAREPAAGLHRRGPEPTMGRVPPSAWSGGDRHVGTVVREGGGRAQEASVTAYLRLPLGSRGGRPRSRATPPVRTGTAPSTACEASPAAPRTRDASSRGTGLSTRGRSGACRRWRPGPARWLPTCSCPPVAFRRIGAQSHGRRTRPHALSHAAPQPEVPRGPRPPRRGLVPRWTTPTGRPLLSP